MPESTPPAVVVGAGIGGLTAALLLARQGRAVTLLERRTTLEEAGAGIQLSPNASRVLVALGLAPALARHAVTPDELVVRSLSSGRRLATMPLGEAMRARFGAPYWVIHRADLHTLLLDAARGEPNIRMAVGRKVTAVTVDGNKARLAVETAGGASEEREAGLAVGADGIWSSVRAALGDKRKPVYRGYAAWRATIPAGEVPEEMAGNVTGLWLGRGMHLVHYPVSRGRLVNIVLVARANGSVNEWNSKAHEADVAQHLGRAVPTLSAIAARPLDWRVWSLFDLPPPRPWGRGPVTLLGDAAHPVLPFLAQGGALAIEDAAVLADALASKPDDVPAALRAYETARQARAVRVQQAARENGRVYHMPAPLSLMRNLVMSRLSGEAMLARYAWLYGWEPPQRRDARLSAA
ncbi:FAD-dependent monooxygenase [Chelatococcus daeguensis]|uniref:FAD-binding monooxygenase n=2 Tax=Chelatococcus TaxID=28209 RepID=A0AAC9JSU8_9HYPH|nr:MULTISPECIES: FAD-dependent monooxygenase [Chelatococcus]APF37916.1 FAD-binding monooxygenase [Chelatococcus daeguensis]KZE28414.1 FAD-binding monooxygenase [Chelatococcus daeguensis]MBM3083365.1 FAD-dependent monooxygenase [Chelatococcus daeguensis]CUA83799.1 2-polyprenyl-6-methoxyphenol hydroxylase and related FAD-dependent oxidoreductases [Chelatococcus sambhunathii]